MKAKVPLDVQFLVIEWVYRSSQHRRIDYRPLRMCALICKAWTPIAQRLLIRRVPNGTLETRSHDERPIVCLLRTLRAAPHLAAHVRTFLKSAYLNLDTDWQEQELTALALCANVQSVVFVGLLRTSNVSPELYTRLEAIPIRPKFIRITAEASQINRVIKIWPSVRALQVFAWSCTQADLPVQMPRALQALSTSFSCIPLLWPAPGAVPPMLHDLDLDCRKEEDMTRPAVLASGVFAQLRTLRIWGDTCARVLPAAVIEQLAVLDSHHQSPPYQ
ncbi:hypothetical protein FA95DRAFT_123746 [Auriscalpium vulgare]|uniref:Uncharacterized protein n=1 Tax=Auriscalpium vulgare TaxID=40419 RepID=A0ACB8RMW5_9AGAM|nr:hypothetical protein FA95DRAFT_123746 [Auriscalpium vulgare]